MHFQKLCLITHPEMISISVSFSNRVIVHSSHASFSIHHERKIFIELSQLKSIISLMWSFSSKYLSFSVTDLRHLKKIMVLISILKFAGSATVFPSFISIRYHVRSLRCFFRLFRVTLSIKTALKRPSKIIRTS